jgi:hypothetical protein
VAGLDGGSPLEKSGNGIESAFENGGLELEKPSRKGTGEQKQPELHNETTTTGTYRSG